MYRPYYNYSSSKKRGVEDLYGIPENPKPAEKKKPEQKKTSLHKVGLREDDVVLALVFLTVMNERNEEDIALLVILALLFFT